MQPTSLTLRFSSFVGQDSLGSGLRSSGTLRFRPTHGALASHRTTKHSFCHKCRSPDADGTCGKKNAAHHDGSQPIERAPKRPVLRVPGRRGLFSPSLRALCSICGAARRDRGVGTTRRRLALRSIPSGRPRRVQGVERLSHPLHVGGTSFLIRFVVLDHVP
jgi:hypothetical protein